MFNSFHIAPVIHFRNYFHIGKVVCLEMETTLAMIRYIFDVDYAYGFGTFIACERKDTINTYVSLLELKNFIIFFIF